jgi:hypothetical protein
MIILRVILFLKGHKNNTKEIFRITRDFGMLLNGMQLKEKRKRS